MEKYITDNLLRSLAKKPDAAAEIAGSPEYRTIRGQVLFRQTDFGVLVSANIFGLPHRPWLSCDHPVFAMHIHEGGSCSGMAEDPFAGVGAHYNPGNCIHPAHAGDLPPLFSNQGRAWFSVLTDRFFVREVIGRTVIIHRSPDDFVSQPSGASGMKIACGVIQPFRR